MTTLTDFTAARLDGDDEPLSAYAGQVVLVVNTASQCGFTPQLAGLEDLYRQFADQGLVVLGFPCNQFGHQEPGTEQEIGEFYELSYGVTFPVFARIDVNGPSAHPLFAWLRTEKAGLLGNAIKWNFTKFLIGRDGSVITRYPSTTNPEKLAGDIEYAIAARAS